MLASVPDLLRLLAVPALGWAALQDVETRRVPNAVWYPLAALGVVLLVVEAVGALPPASAADRLWAIRVGLSLGFVAPLSYLFWRLGGFGGADAKALIALAILVPTYPTYYLPTAALPALPVVETTLGVFSMTVLTNTVLVGVLYPVALSVRNALVGHASPVMFLGRRVAVADLPTRHGRLFEDREGFTRGGLDLDALRMYLRWRGCTLADLRAAPDAHRDPESVAETADPTDGAVGVGPATDGGVRTVGEGVADAAPSADATSPAASGVDAFDDPWAAERFLDEITGSAYGTTPESLREGLEVVTTRDEVWISPGIPFLVPMFVGLVAAFTVGDLLFGLLGLLGLA